MQHVVVVGAGQAGASCVARLRTKGFEGKITLIGEEPVPPYQRPPLSKAYLLGDMTEDRLYLRPESYYSDNQIALVTGQHVTKINTSEKTVSVGEDVLNYSDLVLTTGSTPRRLPAAIGGSLENVLTVRGLSDVDALRPLMVEGAKALIVGGGYIGLEAAAVAQKLGVKATLVEMAPRILQRVAATETSEFFRNLHTRHGVEVLEGVGLERLEGETAVQRAVLGNGQTLDVDFVIVGVGIVPNDELAKSAGLTIDNGIAVDSFGRSSDPHIWSAGDCASYPQDGAQMRLESVGNAIDMAEAVADNIMGAETAYVPKPWFWSDQYDVKLQIAGLSTGYDRVVVRDGGAARSHWYYAGDRLIALDAMNDPRAYMVGKRLIEAGKTADPEVVADAQMDLKPLLRA